MSFFRKAVNALRGASFLTEVIQLVTIIVETVELAEKAIGNLKAGQVPDYTKIVNAVYPRVQGFRLFKNATILETKEVLESYTEAILDTRKFLTK